MFSLSNCHTKIKINLSTDIIYYIQVAVIFWSLVSNLCLNLVKILIYGTFIYNCINFDQVLRTLYLYVFVVL
ncbi:MAG: hypothetical protein ACI9SS_000357 [Gammaproteobacteria bacterium]|jgi:hypothetical protein